MAKQYKVKDINNNGKIDGWEQGKYDAINNSATKMKKPKVIKANTVEGKKKYEERARRLVAEQKAGLKSEKQSAKQSAKKMYKKEKSPMKMGYTMKMGSKEIYTPTNFKTKDAMLMADSPMMMHKKGHDPKKDEGVVVTGDKSKINNEVNVPSKADLAQKRKEATEEKRKILLAKRDEKVKEIENLKQVRKDEIANRRLQLLRKKEGKDYIKPDGTVVRRKVKIVKK